jgi:hypothetical protein
VGAEGRGEDGCVVDHCLPGGGWYNRQLLELDL